MVYLNWNSFYIIRFYSELWNNRKTTVILTINGKNCLLFYLNAYVLTPKPALLHMGSFNSQKCGWALAREVFVVEFSVSLTPLQPQSVHNHVTFTANSSVTPVTLSWDFGDLSPRANTTGTVSTTSAHKYGLPGSYTVSLTALAGHKKVREKRTGF